jgi:hypothetical protein
MLLDKEFLEVVAENGKLRVRIAELEAYVEHVAEQKLTEEMDDDIREIADYEGAYNYMITDARDYLRAARAALKGEK